MRLCIRVGAANRNETRNDRIVPSYGGPGLKLEVALVLQQHEINRSHGSIGERHRTKPSVDMSLHRGDNDAVVLQVVMERQAEHGGRCWFEIVEKLVLEAVEDADEKVLTLRSVPAFRRRV